MRPASSLMTTRPAESATDVRTGEGRRGPSRGTERTERAGTARQLDPAGERLAGGPARLESLEASAVAPPPDLGHPTFTERLGSADEFDTYCQTVANERYSKFLIDIHTDRIYYFDANAFAVHADFVLAELTKKWATSSRVLGPLAKLYNRWQVRERLRAYNRNYEAEKPEFLLGTVVHHLDQNIYTLALWEGDLASAADVRRVYDKMEATFYLGGEVKYRPNSTRQEDLVASPELAGVPTITNDKLYKDAPYHAFTEGAAVGRLRIVRTGNPAELHFGTDEIVVLTEIVPDITPVRGLITEHFCTPLAHVALRARAWGIPHVGMKECSTTYADLDGKTVLFEAKREGAVLREATPQDIEADEQRRAGRPAVELPPADLDARELKWLPEIRVDEARAYGAKSANLGEIAHAAIDAFDVPSGFGIPVVYYAEHLERHGLLDRARTLVADERVCSEPAHREAELKRLRDDIIAAPIAAELETAIVEMLAARGPEPRRVFVRSSTNAEDLPGLNGAGLYDSIPNVSGVDEVAHAVKQVWASVWNLRAYDERAHFGIDHEAVYGAVLVLEGVNASAAGVLITANIFDGGSTNAYTINAKSGLGIGVVEGTSVPEQILFDVGEGGIEIMSRSDEPTILVFDEESGGVKEVPNPIRGQPVLSDDQVRVLARGAEAVTQLFPDDGPLDIEWLFDGDRLRVVQSRPYIGL